MEQQQKWVTLKEQSCRKLTLVDKNALFTASFERANYREFDKLSIRG